MVLLARSGRVKVLGFSLFYRTFGENGKGTVLCLHGGPGATHDYILPLADLAQHGYRVIFYDQLGCGRSDPAPSRAFYTVERAVEEVEEVRRTMRLGRIHLVGSSYGGLLALAYALKYQRNLRSLITTSGQASVPLTRAELKKLKSRLPKQVRRTMAKYEAKGETGNPQYARDMRVFLKKHLCRLNPWPDELVHSLQQTSKVVYDTMNIFYGNTMYWDSTSQLHKILVPTLVTGGRYDQVTPAVAQSIHKRIKGSKLVIFERSSHVPMWEEREEYVRTVRSFLEKLN